MVKISWVWISKDKISSISILCPGNLESVGKTWMSTRKDSLLPLWSCIYKPLYNLSMTFFSFWYNSDTLLFSLTLMNNSFSYFLNCSDLYINIYYFMLSRSKFVRYLLIYVLRRFILFMQPDILVHCWWSYCWYLGVEWSYWICLLLASYGSCFSWTCC